MYEHYELQCSVWLDFVEFRGRINELDRAYNTFINVNVYFIQGLRDLKFKGILYTFVQGLRDLKIKGFEARLS